MEDSSDSDCELIIDETILVDVNDEEEKNDEIGVESVSENNWHLFHPVSISSSDMKDELFNDETNTCSICNETFRYNVGLIYHLAMEHVELKLPSDMNANSKSRKRKLSNKTSPGSVRKDPSPKPETNVTKKWTCDVCKKSFVDNFKLSKHAESCSLKFSCVLCKCKFGWESKYKKHLYKIHKYNAVVVCKYCSNVFGDMSSLAVHSLSCESKSLLNSTSPNQLPQRS